MGTSAIELISNITPLLLGMAGVCAGIALALAVGRHFLYEHGEDDLQPVSKRVTHVFGFLAAIGFVSVGGANLARRWATDSTLNPAISGRGSSLVPQGASKGGSYSNLGDLIMSQANPNPEHMSTSDAQTTLTDPDASPGDVYYSGLVLNNSTEAATPEMTLAFLLYGQDSEEYKEAYIKAYGEDDYNAWRNSRNQSNS